MATNTYVALDTRTVSADVASVDFTNISGAYTDIVVVANVRGATHLYARVGNGTLDTANYYVTSMYGRNVSGSNQSGSERYSSQAYLRMTPFTYVPSATSTLGTVVMNFQNYANTNVAKQILVRSAGVGASNYGGTEATVLLWNSTSAINTLSFYIQSGNILAGSTFTIYGIAAAAPLTAKATGGTITYGIEDGYVYHTFTSSGTFTPTQSLTADILVVAGGGGSGTEYGAGAGAGGLLGFTSQALTTTGYTVTVGAGGAGAGSSAARGNSGSNSQFASLTACIGGGGGGGNYQSGLSGGSGGGGSSASSAGGAGTAGQGYAGGSTSGTGSSGGGGAGEAGYSNTTTSAGGNGSSAYSSWGIATVTGENVNGTRWYAGGGGGNGANGGYGGGGGVNKSGGFPARHVGLANTGGGGASSADNVGRAGGSGIIIVRYLA